MKKVLAIILCAVIVVSSFSFSASAYTYYYSYIVAPSYVSVYTRTDTSLSINWGTSYNADGYLLYCKEQGGSFKKIKTFKGKYKNTYSHKNLTTGKKYTYKVKAYGKISGKKKYSSFSPSASKKVVEPITTTYPSLYSISFIDTDTLEIYWGELSRASGYELYYKISGGSFKKLATLSGKNKTSYTHKNLTADKKYFYKVRAYRSTSKGKIYSKYSGQLGKKCTNYLVDLYKPFNEVDCTEYTGGSKLKIAGNEYGNGLAFEMTFFEAGYATYNLNGKYQYMSFILGQEDGNSGDAKIGIYSDDECIGTYIIKGNSIPKTYKVNIEYASKLEIKLEDEDEGYAKTCIMEIKLYK